MSNIPLAAPEPVTCPNCGNHLGEIIIVAGLRLFHAGGTVDRHKDGWCIQCGKPFYWVASDNQIGLMIRAIRNGVGRELEARKHG